MAQTGRRRYDWEQSPEERSARTSFSQVHSSNSSSYPLSAQSGGGQRHPNVSSTEYNPYGSPLIATNRDYLSPVADQGYEPAIHSPPPVRQTTNRLPRKQPTYEDLLTYDTIHAVPRMNRPAPAPFNYNAIPYNNAPTDYYPASLAPSTNNVSTADNLSASIEATAPLNLPRKPDPEIYQVHDHYHHHQAPDNPYLLEADTWLNRVAGRLRIKRGLQWFDPKFFHAHAWFSLEAPHSFQLPGHYYKNSAGGYINIHKHRDVFRRKHAGLNDDRYLDPLDGRVQKLFVQTVNALYDTENDTTWRRTYISNVSPYIIRLAYWPYSHMPDPQSRVSQDHNVQRVSETGIKTWTQDQWLYVSLRWLPACIGLLLLMCGPTDIEGQIRNHGCYDPVHYRYWSYPKEARNFHENLGEKPTSSPLASNTLHAKDVRLSDRCIRPRMLCFLDSRTNDNPKGCIPPETWIQQHRGGIEPSYIFISYTAEKQLERRCDHARKEIQTTGSSNCNCPKCKAAAMDAEALHKIARVAARKAQVVAYWTDQCCMSTDKDELQDDVYRFSDVVRGAQKIVVIVGRTGQDRLPNDVTTLELLREWGMRMWTWPEVLLGPAREKIQVYTRGGDLANPLELSKMEFPAQVSDDGEVARQLIDNYDNTLTLSRLELVVLALESLKLRAEKGTTKYLEGDLSYALMGLLRQRPRVDKTDSAFQAFARLSLANDSDRLLERLICLLPKQQSSTGSETSAMHCLDPETELPLCNAQADAHSAEKRHYWTNTNDHWGAQLWDIEPACQIAGIGKHDTIILDGAYAATVHWDRFQRVSITTRETWSRMLARYFVRATPGWFFGGVLALSFSAGSASGKGIGALLLIIALVIVLLSPVLILHIYGGKVWNTQPWLFGFEGHMDLRKIETKIFGFPNERLSWAPYGSAMSRHRVNNEFLDTECEGTDPLLVPGESDTGISRPETGEKMRLFTLVDTNTMTVTSFRAARPPVVALLCGSEGGMQRTLMCSYDWTSQTLYRETVLRMETKVLEKMPRIGRVRFGLKRWESEVERSFLRPPD